MDLPSRTAGKNVRNGMSMYPQVIPARSNRGFGTWGECMCQFRVVRLIRGSWIYVDFVFVVL